MITISNKNVQNEEGEHLYFIEINNKYIAEFWHNRKDGLQVCLEDAARKIELINTLDRLKKLVKPYDSQKDL